MRSVDKRVSTNIPNIFWKTNQSNSPTSIYRLVQNSNQRQKNYSSIIT